MFSPDATPGARARRPRRASPLGLMGPSESDIPKENALPSGRAIGFMVGFMIFVILTALLLRGCSTV